MTDVQALLGTYKNPNGDAEPILTILHIDNPQSSIGNISGKWSGKIATTVPGKQQSFAHLDYTVSGMYVKRDGKLYMSLGGQNSIQNHTPVSYPTWLSASVSITGYIETASITGNKANITTIVAYAQGLPGGASQVDQSLVPLRQQ